MDTSRLLLDSLAGNVTAVGGRFGGDEQRARKFQERMEKARERLAELQRNGTLVEVCKASGTDGGDGASEFPLFPFVILAEKGVC